MLASKDCFVSSIHQINKYDTTSHRIKTMYLKYEVVYCKKASPALLKPYNSPENYELKNLNTS